MLRQNTHRTLILQWCLEVVGWVALWEICERLQSFPSPRTGGERKRSSNVLSLWHERARQSSEWFFTPSCSLIDGNWIGDNSGGRCLPCLPSGAAVLWLTEMAIRRAGLADFLQQLRLEAGEISKSSRGGWSEWSLMYLMLIAFIKIQSAGKLKSVKGKQSVSLSLRQGNNCRWHLPLLKTASSSGPRSALGSAWCITKMF